MKLHYRLFSFFLSFSIFIISFFQCSLFVYASNELDITDLFPDSNKTIYDYGTDEFIFGGKTWDELTVNDKIGFSVFYGLSQAKCLVSGDFSSFLNNHSSFADFRTSIENDDGKYVTVDENGITFSEDFTTAMKQALIEYAEETNGFELIPTTDYHDLSASDFKSGYVYHSFRNLVHEAGVLAVSGGGGNWGGVTNNSSYFNFFRPFDADSIKNCESPGPVSLVKASGYNSPYWDKIFYYDTYSWNYFTYTTYECKTYYNNEEGLSVNKVVTSFDECLPKTSGLLSEYSNVNSSYIGWNPKVYFSQFINGYHLYSTDGRKLKVFNSLNALKNYSVGDRGVYFGSGFYDTPGEIKVSFDDLEKYIDGKYDKFFDDLKDLIGKETDNEDSLTEEDLEKLVDKILDKMDETGGNTGDNTGGNTGDNTGGNTGDNSGLLDGISGMIDSITSTLSGYYDAVLMYLQGILTDLDYIVMEMQDMTEEEATTKTDSVLSELKSTFSEVGDVMTKKFPFCIPWDLKQLFVTLNGGKDYSGEEAAMLLSDDGTEDYALTTPENPELPTFKGYTGSGKLVDVIVYSSPSSRASPPSGDSGIMLLAADGAGDDDTTGNDTAGADAGVYRSESGAPVFHIPFVLNSIGLNSALVIDMSPFDGVSDISRTLFLLIFIYQLILLSIRITEFLEGFIG